ncbi:CidA/LrgA family holin-like protein [Paenibacillus sp. sgz500958]|uniref:CidA/LrgA family holin-like protein n=1 Tax=Paenibacillus sp. sgz500958 TaxID=3242475 RepID=UPI0036D2E745
MKFSRIIVQVGLLYLFYLAGDYVQKWTHLPIPGSIVGLLLLFILLLCKVVPVSWIEQGATAVLGYLPLFFIPATAGIVDHLSLFSGKGLLLIVILILSTILTMGVSAQVSQWLAGLGKRKSTAEADLNGLQGISIVREKGEEC